jgi:hypothetical protein
MTSRFSNSGHVDPISSSAGRGVRKEADKLSPLREGEERVARLVLLQTAIRRKPIYSAAIAAKGDV